MSSEVLVPFVGATLFPGAHCLQIALGDAIQMHKGKFLLQTKLNDKVFARWIAPSDGASRSFSVSIPPLVDRSLLQRQPMLTFASHGDANASNSDFVWAKCTLVLFRRELDERPMAQRIKVHAERDLFPLLSVVRMLFVAPDMEDIMERFVLHVVEFYGAVDPTSMTPTLKQRVYSMKDGQYFGHLCSHCGSLGAGLRCVLLFSCV